MKITKTLSATLIASSLIFGATACSAEPDSVEATAEATVGDNTENKSQEQDSTKAVEEVVAVNDEVFAYFGDDENIDTIQGVIQNNDLSQSDEEVANLLKEKLPEAFAFFDTDDTESIASAFVYMSQIATNPAFMDDTDATVTTPKEAVTVTGDTATVDRSQLKSSNGITFEKDDINYVKKDGEWLINAPIVDLDTGERVE